MIFKNSRIYDVMKWAASVCLPALATLVLTLGQIWGFSDIAVPVGATIAAVAAFIGALVGVGAIRYAKLNKGGEPDV